MKVYVLKQLDRPYASYDIAVFTTNDDNTPTQELCDRLYARGYELVVRSPIYMPDGADWEDVCIGEICEHNDISRPENNREWPEMCVGGCVISKDM